MATSQARTGVAVGQSEEFAWLLIFDLIEAKKDLLLCLGSKPLLTFSLRQLGCLWRPGCEHLKVNSRTIGIIW